MIAMQFGVHLDPGMLLEIEQAPICLQPVFTIRRDGTIVMHDEEEGNAPPADDDRPPSSGGGPPPTGPGGPPKRLYRGGADLTPRLDVDVRIDKQTGLLRTDRDISLFDDPTKVERFGGAYEVENLPEGLKIQQRGMNPGHYELMPAEPMSFEEYGELLKQVRIHLVSGK